MIEIPKHLQQDLAKIIEAGMVHAENVSDDALETAGEIIVQLKEEEK